MPYCSPHIVLPLLYHGIVLLMKVACESWKLKRRSSLYLQHKSTESVVRQYQDLLAQVFAINCFAAYFHPLIITFFFLVFLFSHYVTLSLFAHTISSTLSLFAQAITSTSASFAHTVTIIYYLHYLCLLISGARWSKPDHFTMQQASEAGWQIPYLFYTPAFSR